MAAALPPTALPRAILPINAFATAAVAGLAVWFLADLAEVVAYGYRFVLLGQAIADPSAGATFDSGLELVVTMDYVETGGYVVAGIAFLVWLFRARANAEAIQPVLHRRGLAWLVLAWIVPVVNFWFPKQIVDDIWKTSDLATQVRDLWTVRGGPGFVRAWWLVFVLHFYITDGILPFLIPSATFDDLRLAAGLEVLLAPIGWVAALLAVVVIRRITNRQESQRVGRA